MKLSNKTYLILVTAVASLPLLAKPALAQQRVGSDGHALDANNRIGSGGTNTPSQSPQSTQLGNDIVTGNVTGLGAFQGRINYTDPNAFRIANLPGSGVDRFNAISAAPSSASPAGPSITPYYGTSTTAAPPPGYIQTPTNTGYVPAPTPTGQAQSDLRLNLPQDTSIQPLPLQGVLLLPGQVDPMAASPLSASANYGSREWLASQSGDTLFMFNHSGQGPVGPEDWATPTQNRVDELRRELNSTLIADQNIAGTTPGQSNNPANNAAQPGNNSNQNNTGNSNVTPGAKPLTSLNADKAAPIQPTNLTAANGDMSTNQSSRRYLAATDIPAPAQQSALYRQLKDNLTAYDANHPMTDQEANQKFMAILNQQRALAAANGGPAAPVVNPNKQGGGAVAPNGIKPAPVAVGSLAAGIRARGLADILTQAEDAIRKGQYGRAIDDYNEAADVAPNNALILIGRANAELAGSYYKQAEADIRNAYLADHAVLLAQFNLNDLLGARLPYVVDELKQIASNSPENPTPVFLLSYLSYNTGNAVKAQGYLDLADKRSGGSDPVIELTKKYWTFTDKQPAPTTQPEMNK